MSDTDDQDPGFPLDEATLERLWEAVHVQPGNEHTRLFDFLDRLGEETGTAWSEHDVIASQILEIRRLRTQLSVRVDPPQVTSSSAGDGSGWTS